jgi:MoaA/NifB/PqqE/SkfB family radical SAM enzyme
MKAFSFKKKIDKKYEYKMLWTPSDFCNYNCIYCFNPPSIGFPYATKKYSPLDIARSFDETGKSWLIMFLGGEPFMMPDFLPLLRELTRKHDINISTNLCSDDVFKFPDFVPSEQVMVINASLHVLEREKEDPGFEKFIEKYFFLEEKGYRILVSYVTWPPLFNRIEKDFNYLRSRGIENIMPIIFRGMYNGKEYPFDYSPEEINLLSNLVGNKSPVDFKPRNTNNNKMTCEAGYKYFYMDYYGNVSRCNMIQNEKHGNLFEGTFKPNTRRYRKMSEECKICWTRDKFWGELDIKEVIFPTKDELFTDL